MFNFIEEIIEDTIDITKKTIVSRNNISILLKTGLTVYEISEITGLNKSLIEKLIEES